MKVFQFDESQKKKKKETLIIFLSAFLYSYISIPVSPISQFYFLIKCVYCLNILLQSSDFQITAKQIAKTSQAGIKLIQAQNSSKNSKHE